MKHDKSTTPKIQIKTYSTKEVAGLYGISGKTLKKWLMPFEGEIGKRIGYYYNPKQIGIIFEKLGSPEQINLN